MYVGRQVDCPDFHSSITIVADGAKRLTARKSTPEDDEHRASSDEVTPRAADSSRQAKRSRRLRTNTQETTAEHSAPAAHRRFSAILSALKTPVGVAWSVAGLTTLIVTIAVWPRGRPAQTTLPTTPHAKQQQNPAGPQGAEQAGTPPAASRTPAELFAARLKEIGRKLDEYHQRHGHFPRGTAPATKLPSDRRLSWMAELLEEFPLAKTPRLWTDKPWDDPLNEEFVRRRITEFQNPAIGQLVGAHGYPAAHIVGMAGVGTDAAMLPVTHPRAGVFGYDRSTRRKDITDGTANTILIAGVRDHLGSWAAGGRASIRPVTRPPYVNGPDGFGTGRADGMTVLMADGSVRFLSTKTDPRVVRRMAAMADGLDLDLKIAGEPGDRRKQPSAGPAEPHSQPREPVAAPKPQGPPDPEPIDVAARLQQPILRFDQSQAVPVRDLLFQVGEMAGAPIRFDQPSNKDLRRILDRRISLTLTKTTVGGILKAILDRAGLSYRIETGGIRVGNKLPDEPK